MPARVVHRGAASPPGLPASSASAGYKVAPYLYEWGAAIDPVLVMQASGVRVFTLAFVLAAPDGDTPNWDGGSTNLLSGNYWTLTQKIRAAGGDVIASSGGATSSLSLEVNAASASTLSAAYLKVIDAYGLEAFDVNLEDGALAAAAVQDKTLAALRLVKAARPDVQLIVTIPVGPAGARSDGLRLIKQAAAGGSPVDVWSAMTFDFGTSATNMSTATLNASEALHAQLRGVFPAETDTALYAAQGISTMNGVTDTGEVVTLANAQDITAYAASHTLGRLAFWAVNRDRPGTDAGTSASGISHSPWAFTSTFARYTG